MAADQLFDRQFAQVCRGTAGQPAATAYEPRPGVHPFLVLKSTDGTDYVGLSSGTYPEGWHVKWPDLAEAELVVCATQVSATPTEICEGYTDDDSDTEWTVQTHDVVYEYTVRSATTAEELGTQKFEAPGKCPMFSMYNGRDALPLLNYPTPSTGEVEVFLQPFVTGG
ncbi:hypothetical protein [Rubrivirga sp.]|uniref:hypothetical protein n=1 Tax=Rubrivirga sp. TaxID=1885344 RepID=UPI003C7097F5